MLNMSNTKICQKCTWFGFVANKDFCTHPSLPPPAGTGGGGGAGSLHQGKAGSFCTSPGPSRLARIFALIFYSFSIRARD